MNRAVALILALFLLPVPASLALDLDLDKLQRSIDVDKVVQFGKKVVQATRSFNEEERYYIGRASGARLLADHRLLAGAKLQQYVSAIGQTLAMASKRPEVYAGYHFIVLDDLGRVNAYAVPGGFIFITTGLIAKTTDEDELAAVLAHEVSHIVLDHPIGSIKKQYRDQLMKDILSEAGEKLASEKAKKIGELAGGLSNLSNMMVDFAAKGYSREKEQEADLAALSILRGAGYDASRFPYVLARLSAIGSGLSGTHGNPEERAAHIRRQVAGDAPRQVKARQVRFEKASATLGRR